MSERRAIVIVVDGLRASALGTYGNSWHPTPAFDQLASRSIVVETMWCEQSGLVDFYQVAGAAAAGLALVTDDEAVAQWADAQPGADVWYVDLQPIAAAGDLASTALARLFAAAAERLEAWAEAPASPLFWLHARGFHGPWDAPLALRAALLEDDDLAAPEFVAPPRCEATGDHDALLAFRAAYAAQVSVLDECLGALLAVAGEVAGGDELLVVVAGCRGFALGEHGAVGTDCRELYGELLHVPCLLQVAGGAPAPPRRDGLATPADLGATLATWLGRGSLDILSPAHVGVDLLADAAPRRQFVASDGPDGERSLRTADWFLRLRPRADDPGDDGFELYAKPDDRWEANEVADRCPDVVECLLAVLARAVDAPPAAAFEPISALLDAEPPADR
jgi:hypothetical protein